MILSAYVAASGVRYEAETHTDAVFEAQEAGEPEVQDFPHGYFTEAQLAEIESRMGFVAPDGSYMTRDETLARFGFDLAEDQDGEAAA